MVLRGNTKMAEPEGTSSCTWQPKLESRKDEENSNHDSNSNNSSSSSNNNNNACRTFLVMFRGLTQSHEA